MRFLFACFVSLFLCAFVFANEDSLLRVKQKARLVVCSESGQLPYEMRNKQGAWFGFDVELMQAFAQHIGVKVEFRDVKWDGMIPALITGKCDAIASSMVATEERQKVVSFSSTVIEDGVLGVAQKNRFELVDKANLNSETYDIPSLKIAVPQGTVSDFTAQKIFRQAHLVRYETNADAFTALLTNKVDILICDKSYVLLMNSLHHGQLQVFANDLYKENVAVAFKKRDNELRQAFNTFFLEWKKSGAYHQTIQKFFGKSS